MAEESESGEALRERAERLQYVLEAADAGYWDWDAARRELHCSARALAMLGYREADVAGPDWAWGLVHPDDAATCRRRLEEHLEGAAGIAQGELRVRSRAGAWRWVHARAKVVRRGSGGEPVRVVGTVVDVTERVELRSRLILADRMASLGTLAAGVGHEINNPLSYLVTNIAFALDQLHRVHGPGDPDGAVAAQVREALEEAQQGAARVRAIVAELKAFTRASEQNGPVDLARVVTSCLSMARHALGHRVRVVVEAGAVPPVLGNEARLGQVVLNLLLNAVQATPEERGAQGVIRVALRQLPSGGVALAVVDRGVGIAPDVLPRIFDPFFTTKPVGVGTGLGLAISHGIVTSLGGEITVESVVGEGTTFTVVLPPHRPGAPAPG